MNKKRIGFYPGTFAPFHKGHLNILGHSDKIFDQVIIGVGCNPEKDDMSRYRENHYFPGNYSVHYYRCLTTEKMKELSLECDADVYLILGCRNESDFQINMTTVQVMRDIDPDLKYIMLISDPEFRHISSSMIRGLMRFEGYNWRKYLIGG